MKKDYLVLKKIDRIIYRIVLIISVVSAACLIFMAFLCTGDVLSSKFLSKSIPNATELITFLNLPVVFCSIAYVQMDRGHTSVDLICNRFPKFVQKVIHLAGCVMGTVICAFAGYCAWNLTIDKLEAMTKSSSAANAFVVWPFAAFEFVGFILVAIAFAWCIVRECLGLKKEDTVKQIEGGETKV